MGRDGNELERGEQPEQFEALPDTGHEDGVPYAEKLLGAETVRDLTTLARAKVLSGIEDGDFTVAGGRYAAARLLLGMSLDDKERYRLLLGLRGEILSWSTVPELATRRFAEFRVSRGGPIGKNRFSWELEFNDEESFVAMPENRIAKSTYQEAKVLFKSVLEKKLHESEVTTEEATDAANYKLAYLDTFWSEKQNDEMVFVLEEPWREGIDNIERDGIIALRQLALARVLKSDVAETEEEGIELRERHGVD